jgi:hypothetical protein
VQARSPLVALRPTAGALAQLAVAAAPILNEEDARGMRDLLWFVENWALALKGRDALGHFVGAELQIDPSILLSAVDSYINNTGLSSSLNRRTATATATPSLKPTHPASAAPPAKTPPLAPSASPSAPSATSASAGQPAPTPSAAGASANSIQQLLTFLIGK